MVGVLETTGDGNEMGVVEGVFAGVGGTAVAAEATRGAGVLTCVAVGSGTEVAVKVGTIVRAGVGVFGGLLTALALAMGVEAAGISVADFKGRVLTTFDCEDVFASVSTLLSVGSGEGETICSFSTLITIASPEQPTKNDSITSKITLARTTGKSLVQKHL